MQTESTSTPTPASSPTVFLACPDVLRRKNCFLDRLTPEEEATVNAWRKQAAERLREALCSVPWYAKKAEKARLAGNEMAYWLDLQGSEMTLLRPACSTAETVAVSPAVAG